MALSPIIIHGQVDDLVKQFNQLVDDYNLSPSLSKLQKIDGFAKHLRGHYKQNPSQNTNEVMKWILQDHITTALRELPGTDPSLSNEKNFLMQGPSQLAKDLLKEKVWVSYTKPSLLSTRSQQYRDIDTYLAKLSTNFYKANLEGMKDSSKNRQYYNSLKELQTKIMSTLLNDIPADKPQMRDKFEELLTQTNWAMNTISETAALKDTLAAPPENPLLDRNLFTNPQNLKEFVTHLAFSEATTEVNDFHLIKLGGNNNKNWLATREEDQTNYVIRLEKADDPATDYDLLAEVKTNPELNKHLAEDSLYYPLQPIIFEEHSADLTFNIAVSEYCPQGDTLRVRKAFNSLPINEDNLKLITDQVLDMSQQVTTIASDFNEARIPYPDIKSENFLRRPDGTVITADTKSLIRADSDNNIKINMISTSFEPPEMRTGNARTPMNAESFMVYQTGLLIHDLMLGQEAVPHESGQKLKPWTVHYYTHPNEPLVFDDPIYQTEAGSKIKDLVKSAINPNPAERPSLDEVSHACNSIRSDLGLLQRQEQHLEQNAQPQAPSM